MTQKQLQVLKFIQADNSISRKEIADRLGVTERTVRKHIEALKKKGVIGHFGGDFGGAWKIVFALDGLDTGRK